jgi:hypothetical protein
MSEEDYESNTDESEEEEEDEGDCCANYKPVKGESQK